MTSQNHPKIAKSASLEGQMAYSGSDDEKSDIYVNHNDGLESLNCNGDYQPDGMGDGHLEKCFSVLNMAPPNSVVIVTNLLEAVFTSTDAKMNFESLFLQHDPDAQFHYLKCFRRARVIFRSPERARCAHSSLNNSEFFGHPFRCYFAQPIKLSNDMIGHRQHLEPPPLDKQFLISPPASPPVGWEVINEKQPAINYDLIAAMAKLGPGDKYELHSGSESQPTIIVHVCEDPDGYEKRPPKIVQTQCPARKP